jgi:hypothetical protein
MKSQSQLIREPKGPPGDVDGHHKSGE